MKLRETINDEKLRGYNILNLNTINHDISLQWLISYSLFFIAILYTLSFLPYGRFYNKLGGNFALLFSYFYIFLHVSPILVLLYYMLFSS